MAELLQGKPVSDAIVAAARQRAAAVRAAGVAATLVVIRVGQNPGDLSYERSLRRCADAADVAMDVWELPETVSQRDLETAVLAANADVTASGCLVFRPLPPHLDEGRICNMIDPAKDIDGVTRASLAEVFMGSGAGFAPSTAQACVALLDHYGIELDGARMAVAGRSLVVGRPLAALLLSRNATVTMCHSHTRDLQAACRNADVVVCATGRARAFGKGFFCAGQTVVDVGINFDEAGVLCGDVDFAAIEPVVSAITPVPGGVGSVTAAIAIDHTVKAAERAARLV